MTTRETARYRFIGGLLALGFLAAALSQARVQVFGRDEVLRAAKESASGSGERIDPARRGAILSADGRVIAQTVDAYELRLDTGRIPRSPGFFLQLSEAVGIPAAELAMPTPEGRSGRVWRRALGSDRAGLVRDVRRRWGADGVSLARVTHRSYALGEAGAGVLGTLRDDGPVGGIERSFHEELMGEDGLTYGFYDRDRRFVPDPDRAAKAKRPGQDVTLTIDSELQAAASLAVREAVESNRALRGCAVVVDPTTGDVLALANWPSFDPSGPIPNGADFNMATMGAYEPGSTFKVLTLAKALDAGVVQEHSHTACRGSLEVGKRRIHCALHNGTRAHGDLDLEKAIAKSCNVAAAQWAIKVGRPEMVRFMESMGLFERPDLGLPGVQAGSFVRDDFATALQTANFGFGQALSCVPVQLAAAYAALANDGTMMRARLVKRVGEEDRGPQEQGEIVSPAAARTVLRLMESVVETDFGTGKALRIPGYRLAGKTGTAQKIGTSDGQYVSNFVGYVPARAPRAVVLVMVDSPSAGRYYGGSVAGPVFVEIAKAVVRRLGIPPDRPGTNLDERTDRTQVGGGSLNR